MATALRNVPHNVNGEAELERLLRDGRQFSAEFPLFLANHLPMVLVALHRLGASDERLREYFAWYRDTNHLQVLPAPGAAIERANWSAAFGDREREADYRAFFNDEVGRLGAKAAVGAYLSKLLPGIAASATHGFMRLAYGVQRDDRAEIAAALGYWAATYLELGAVTGAAPTTGDPVAVLLRMRGVEAYAHVEIELDLLWHFMRAVAAKPEFRPVVDLLAIGPETSQRVRRASLALYAGTMDFCALHAVTGCHWLRMIQPASPDPDLALRYFWQAIATLYPKLGFPDMPAESVLEDWRHLPCPDWPEIESAAIMSNDEHDLSLVFSAREEWKTFGDRLYQIVAARRVGLIS
jgi:Questin oxidase-like